MSDDIFDQVMREAKEIVSRTKLERGKIVPLTGDEAKTVAHCPACDAGCCGKHGGGPQPEERLDG